MKTDLLVRAVLITAVSAPLVALSACGASAPTSTGPSASSSAPVVGSRAAAPASSGSAAGAPFGAGCGLLSSGIGSPGAMAGQRLTTAAAHDPALTSLVAAVVRAHLAESLDSQQAITVLAPSNAAFAAVPRSTLHALLGDTAKLTRVLTHHVIQGRLAPEQLAGPHTTLANDTVTVTGSGRNFAVTSAQTMLRSRPATVVCGDLRTANATVYIIDQVLSPQG